MNRKEKQQVADTLLEKNIKIRVGLFSFRVKQPTLGQLYEMGAVANDIDEKDIQHKIDVNQRVNVIAEAIAHYKDARIMQQVFMVIVFRNRLWRCFWRRYIYHRLTVESFNQLITFLGRSVNINFFLTSIIFLKQTTKVTDPSPMIAPGQPSVE